MKNNFAYAAYSQNNTAIESPEKLIEMLYEGVLRFGAQAKKLSRMRILKKRLIG